MKEPSVILYGGIPKMLERGLYHPGVRDGYLETKWRPSSTMLMDSN